jgi:hypothetical protein
MIELLCAIFSHQESRPKCFHGASFDNKRFGCVIAYGSAGIQTYFIPRREIETIFTAKRALKVGVSTIAEQMKPARASRVIVVECTYE